MMLSETDSNVTVWQLALHFNLLLNESLGFNAYPISIYQIAVDGRSSRATS